MIKLGVNIDHIATVRQARRETFPDPVQLAKEAIKGGAQGITAHLREDRRHIQDDDIMRLKNEISVPLNLEMAAVPSVMAVALKVKPSWCCLVPERREELTTEGGLDVPKYKADIKEAVQSLQESSIKVSLFIDAHPDIIKLVRELKADAIEIHTGPYARAFAQNAWEQELKRVVATAQEAKAVGLVVNAGHGLDYENVGELARAFPFHEFNIGFSIVARALSVGMESAVAEMKKAMTNVCVAS